MIILGKDFLNLLDTFFEGLFVDKGWLKKG